MTKLQNLIKLENKVIQKQITLLDLVASNSLYSKNIKKIQIRLIRSLHFQIVAIHKNFKYKELNTIKINNVYFNYDLITKYAIY